jgi:glutathione S-transferase
LTALAQWLEGRDYLLGRFTVADILMTTVLRFVRHTDLVAGFAVLDAYVKRCEARPAFQKVLRDQMADYAQNAPVAA